MTETPTEITEQEELGRRIKSYLHSDKGYPLFVQHYGHLVHQRFEDVLMHREYPFIVTSDDDYDYGIDPVDWLDERDYDWLFDNDLRFCFSDYTQAFWFKLKFA